MIQNRVHLIISLESGKSCEILFKSFIFKILNKLQIKIKGMNVFDLCNLFRLNSTIASDFYIDVYKPLHVEILNSIARYYLTLQIEENKAKKLNKKKFLNRFDDVLEENMSTKDIHLLSSCMVEMHCTARDAYLNTYTRNKNFDLRWPIFLPKPFTVSMFQQLSVYFLIYMRRIKEQESIKIEKFERAFRKIDEVGERLRGYDHEKEILYKKLQDMDHLLNEWDVKIEKQKDAYRLAVDECKKEEKLVDEMSAALEKLKTEV